MGDKSDPLDAGIGEIAARQHGIITHRELLALGIGRNGISARARRGALHRVHRGIYAVGHRPISQEGWWMAAVLACGAGSVLSHGSAAALWGLLRPGTGSIHVSVPTHAGRRRQRGITLHRRAALASQQVTEYRGIPVTTPRCTIDDLRSVVAPYLVRRATRQAEIAKLIDSAGSDRTRSDLERDFLRLCRDHGIPAPEVNIKLGRWTVDFLWRRQCLAVEADSYDYHRGRVAFQDDRARDLDLRRRGFEVRRFSEDQVNHRPAEVAADLRQALGRAGRPRD